MKFFQFNNCNSLISVIILSVAITSAFGEDDTEKSLESDSGEVSNSNGIFNTNPDLDSSAHEEYEGDKKTLGNAFINRVNRLFPYFPFTKFSGGTCTNSNNAVGTCISPKECRFRQGTSIGNCQGQGACCQFQKSCADSKDGKVFVRNNQENIVAANPQACQFIIPKPKGVCQVRLDFTESNLASPSNGNCMEDYIKITGATNLDRSFTLCGNLTEQHIYLTYGTGEELTLESVLKSTPSRYNIRVSHIRCNSAESVPSTCTQYYTGITGDVKSFNFKDQHINNQRYTVCIKQDSPQIEWSVCSNPMASSENFLVSGAPADRSVTNPELCQTDFVQIFGGNRQCGNQFKTFRTAATPFLLNVNFDGSEINTFPEFHNLKVTTAGECNVLKLANPMVNCAWKSNGCFCSFPSSAGDTTNIGFCLSYKQIPDA